MISAKAIVTLAFFIISTVFVIAPVSIPLPAICGRRLRIPLNLNTAPILALAILWAAQCIGATEIRRGIVGVDDIKPYNILILFFSLAYMSITLDITGVLQAGAFWVSNKGGTNGRRLYLYFYLMLTLISMIIGNDPVILSGTVFLIYYTAATKLDPLAWLISEFAATNTASMVLFLGNPTNVVVCEGFSINGVAFSAYTIFPFIACSISCYIALRFQFRGPNHIPNQLCVEGRLDPYSVLHDPVSACVGGALLVTCLAATLAVGFFGVDVWIITLPFALAKFIFDLGWDYYRFVRVKLLRGTKEREDGLGSQAKDDSPAALKTQLDLPSFPLVPTTPFSGLHKSCRPELEKLDDTSAQMETRSENTQPPRVELLELPIDRIAHPAPEGQSQRLCVASPAKGENSAVDQVTGQPASRSCTPLAEISLAGRLRVKIADIQRRMKLRFPTFITALPRLPFALVPFAFSQFILIQGLAHQGWITIFANWLVKASHREMYATIWLIGVLAVILCNLAGTNIGATILLTKVMREAALPPHTARAGAIALAVASNIGAVSFTFSSSLAGLLWQTILIQKGVQLKQQSFAYWNLIPITTLTSVGLAVVCAEMAIVYKN